MTEYKLYWIHDKEHTDPFSQGYVGITKRDTKQRFHEHVTRKGYEDKEFSVLCIGSQEYISALEAKLRPESWIGWNNAPGGLTGGRPTGITTSGWKHSEESRKARSKRVMGENNPNYGKPTSKKQKEAVSKARKGVPNPGAGEAARKNHAEGKLFQCDSKLAKKMVAARRPRKWYTNGTDNKAVCEGDPIPEGYSRGRTTGWKTHPECS
jgi:hypothetical protein